jgi:hypothetical protein
MVFPGGFSMKKQWLVLAMSSLAVLTACNGEANSAATSSKEEASMTTTSVSEEVSSHGEETASSEKSSSSESSSEENVSQSESATSSSEVEDKAILTIDTSFFGSVGGYVYEDTPIGEGQNAFTYQLIMLGSGKNAGTVQCRKGNKDSDGLYAYLANAATINAKQIVINLADAYGGASFSVYAGNEAKPTTNKSSGTKTVSQTEDGAVMNVWTYDFDQSYPYFKIINENESNAIYFYSIGFFA